MMNFLRSNNYTVFLLRMGLLYAVFMLCRAVFWAYNASLIGPVPWRDVPAILRGSLVFDSVSVLYVNGPFILLSLLPFHFRERKGYQTFLLWWFVATNALALLVNIADIFYYPFKLARIASDDVHFVGEGNFGLLMKSFLADYWGGVVLWLGCTALLYFGFRWLAYRPAGRHRLRPGWFFASQTLLLGVTGAMAVFAIRGFTFSHASYPISMSDATLFVRPNQSSLVLSNPFCLIRTLGQKVPRPLYFPEEETDARYPVVHGPVDSAAVRLEGRPNILLIVLESFATAHIKALSDRFGPEEPSHTPFLDSLIGESYVFANAYQNGLRSIDALPAIWASIPSFKIQFLSLPQSVAEYKALPACLDGMGYQTLFFHGAVRESMSFVAFGQRAGVRTFYSREDYERERGTGDFDGQWGIWDHKFLPFVAEKLNETPRPFFATLFTLSSHHPFRLPPGFEGRFPEGKLPIHRVISYSDGALREFFRTVSKAPWFRNTLFILAADHGSGADNDKYRSVPYNYGIPILFYYPGGELKGRHEGAAQHLDIMPTVLRMVGYDRPFFAFGRDVFNDPDAGFAINYFGGAFNYITDSVRYVFNEKEVLGAYRYREDVSGKRPLPPGPADSVRVERMKAFIQQYYKRLQERNFKP